LREISVIVVRHGFGDLLGRSKVAEEVGPVEATPDPTNRALSKAQRLRRMLEELGPTFVKFGQVLSSRADLLPPPVLRELTQLQDRVAPLPLAVVRGRIEEELGKPVAELFASIDAEPLASASIAQVHGATLHGGESVVIKVQRPGIGERVAADVDLLHALARFLEAVVEETGIYTPTGLVEEFERSLREELDFQHEAANLRRFAELNADRAWLCIPRLYESLSGRRVLTMERLHGVKVTALEARHDRAQVARNLVDGLFTQLFVDGLFHADPHPGNLLVLDDNRIGLVDFGLVGRVTPSMQETVIVLCLAVALRDPDTVARVLYRAGIPDERVSLAQFRSDIATLLDRHLGRRLSQLESRALLEELLDLALRYRIKVPREYALLTKAAITIEGVLRQVAPELDVLAVAMPYAKQLLYERMTPREGTGAGLRAMLQLQGALAEMPLQLSQVLYDLEAGKLTVRMQAAELSQLVQALKWLGIVLFAGLTSAALIVGSFIVLAQRDPWEVRGVPVLPTVGLFMAPMLFGMALTWTLLSGRVHKLSLRRLLRRGRRETR